MACPCPLAGRLGQGVTDDTLVSIARFLPNARDLLCLGLTCPRFAAKIIAAGVVGEAGGGGSVISAADAVARGGGGAAVGGGLQRAGAGLGTSSWA